MRLAGSAHPVERMACITIAHRLVLIAQWTVPAFQEFPWKPPLTKRQDLLSPIPLVLARIALSSSDTQCTPLRKYQSSYSPHSPQGIAIWDAGAQPKK